MSILNIINRARHPKARWCADSRWPSRLECMSSDGNAGKAAARALLTLVSASMLAVCGIGSLQANDIAPKPLTLSVSSFQPNILLIPDTSESMQEGLSLGRLALDWDNCVPGPAMDPVACPAGARSPLSKASIVKSVGLNLIQTYRDQVNMGLMSYQQNPVSQWRNDVFDNPAFHVTGPGTVLWRLTHRPGDIRYAQIPNPGFFDPDFTGSLTSDTKRFSEPHPTLPGVWVFYNFAAPGYHRDETSGLPVTDATTFAHFRNFNVNFPYRIYNTMAFTGGQFTDPDSGLRYDNDTNSNWVITLTDSMRQRGIPSWGTRVLFTQTNQVEWRSNTSPGLGYLHVPIRSAPGASAQDDAHWDALIAKLQPQRHDWQPGDGNVLVDPNWPLTASGLTPLEGTMRTARDYFVNAGGAATPFFGANQGWNAAIPPLPESCGINANIWVTDGLPTVRADGTLLGQNPPLALAEAAEAIEDFYSATAAALGEGVRTYIVGFALPPGVGDLPGMPDDPLDVLAQAGATGHAIMADDFEQLQAAMTSLFDQIIADSAAEFGAISSGAVAIDGALGFRTLSDPSDWTGDVLGLRNPNLPNEEIIWNASDEIPAPNDRNLLTRGNLLTDGRAFTEAAFAADNAFDELYAVLLDPADNEIIARNIIRYLRGGANAVDMAEITAAGLNFQPYERSSLVGNFNRANPTLQRVRNFGWARLPTNEGGGNLYNEFVRAKEDLREIVYVGSNLGVLHAFDLRTGEEVFGYVPRAIYPQLFNMATRDFQYTVDGEVRLFDAYDGSNWRQILVGTLGAGGRGVYALDVTAPENPQVLWDLTAEDLPASSQEHLGLSFAAAEPARLKNGDWVIVMGNGYHSPVDQARLLVFDLFDGGTLLHDVRLGAEGTPGAPFVNGLSTPRVAQDFNNRLTWSRWVYAGDLQGNLWRVELGEGKTDTPDVKRLFEGDRPITMMPQTIYPEGRAGYLVAFGTGKFFELGDDITQGAPNEYFYVLNDTALGGPGQTGIKHSDLENRTPTASGSTDGLDPIDLFEDNLKGWYVQLNHNGRDGARALFTPDERLGRILFTSFRPDDDPCAVGGTNEVYLMNLRGGVAAFPTGNGEFSAFVSAPILGAPVPAFFVTRVTVVDPVTGERIAATDIIPGPVAIADPELDRDARVRAFGERQQWRQTQ
jgi:type IV pilus assembly protein PilY1